MSQLQNFLNPNEFRFTLSRLPHVEFFVQGVNLPDISSSPVETPTPFKTIYRPADKIEFGDLTLTVLIDENMQSYLETWNWLIALTKPENFEQYADLIGAGGDGIYSDATLTLLSSKKNPNVQITFKDMFPISVGSIALATNATDVTPPVVDMTFRYSSYNFDLISA